jgi:uncharacterized protein (TIRG00374 family)
MAIRARALRWGLRLAGLALAAYVVSTQVRWSDEVRLADGTRVEGRVVSQTAEAVQVEAAAGGAPRRIAREEVATTTYGGREIPAVTLGFPSLARRLSTSLPTVAGVLLALFALALLTAWRWRWLVHALGLALSAADAARYTLYGIFFNLVIPGATGGDVVKAYYAAKRTGVATKAVVSVFVDRVVGLLSLVLLAAGILFLGPDREGFGPARVVVGAALAGGVVLAALFLSRRVRRATGLSALLKRLPFQHVWKEADAAFRLYRSRPGSLAVGFLVSLANHAGTAVCAFLLADALGLERVTLAATVALVPVVSLLAAVPLLPGGWGVGELAFAYFFGQVGVPPTEAVGWSVVFRLAVLASGLPGGVLWLLAHEATTRTEMATSVQAAERGAEALAERA